MHIIHIKGIVVKLEFGRGECAGGGGSAKLLNSRVRLLLKEKGYETAR